MEIFSTIRVDDGFGATERTFRVHFSDNIVSLISLYQE